MSLNFQLTETNPKDIPSRISLKLKNLGISGFILKDPIIGPIVTGFPIELGLTSNVPIAKLLAKEEDLALAIGVEAVDIRRVNNQVIVFVPNEERKIVDFKDALYWYLSDDEVRKMKLPLLIGQSFDGINSIIDLAEQPHVLIAGSTGSGKSVFEASIIASLSLLKSEEELELYLIDTKQVDLVLFKDLKQVKELANDIDSYYSLINYLQGIVEQRNRLLAKSAVRNITEYNLLGDTKKLPYIVLVIDELADLIQHDNARRLIDGKNHVELKVIQSLGRLVQISRASGIHVICCTQRTSVDVVNGVVKANFPTRISLKLPSSIDSRVILDEKGAENLLGYGDMLVKATNWDSPRRFHAPFVRLEDIEVVINQREMIRQGLNLE
jgi:DNA segregation ATPase FtsK/SpoIIIE, S-DNA-T family